MLPSSTPSPAVQETSSVSEGLDLLSRLCAAIEAALLAPDDVDLWDAAGRLRAEVLGNPQAALLLHKGRISPADDLDRLERPLKRILKHRP